MEHNLKHFLSIIFASANAADFPQKTIRVIVSVPGGGNIGACAMNVGVYREKLPYHPEHDLPPVMLIGMISNIFVANNKLPVKILPK